MRRPLLAPSAMALALALPSPVRAAADLAELERRALAESPELAAARDRLASVRALAAAAGVFEDPDLMLEARQIVPAGEREPAEALLVLEQPLPGRGQRAAARGVAAAEVALAEVELGRAEQRLLAGIRTDWAEIYAYDRERTALAEAHEVLELLGATVATLYGAGREGAAAVIQAELERAFHELEMEEVDARLAAVRARLSARVGAESALGEMRIEGLPFVVLPKIDPQTAAPWTLEVVVADRRVALAEARLEATRALRSLGWSVGGGVIVRDGLDPNLLARVGVELPFFRSRRVGPAVAAAEAELAAVREERRRAELAARSELTRWLVDGRRQESALRRLAEGIVPQASAALEAALIELQNGSADLADALVRFKEWFDAKLEVARAEAGRYAAWAEIEALLASPVPPAAEGASR